MADISPSLLVHTITVAARTAGAYLPPVAVHCFLDGDHLFCNLAYADSFSTGSRITRADGAVFYVTTSKSRDDGGLGAPQHLEVSTEPAAYLPDLGELYRPSAGGSVVNEDTGELNVTASTPVWMGPCSVEPTASAGSSPELGDQQVGVVPFVITVPLELADVRVGDLFKVTHSTDTRLPARTLVVKAVLAATSASSRQVLAFDNQGG